MGVLIGLAVIGASLQPPPDVRTVLELEGIPSELAHYRVVGASRIERAPGHVRSGSGCLRVRLGPPDPWPGLHVQAPLLSQAGWTWLRLDVHNPGPGPYTLHVRVDDSLSRGADEDQIHRSRHRLEPGWNVVSLALDELLTPSGRKLDPAALTRAIFQGSRPEAPVELLFDHLRFERAAGVEPPDPEATLESFERRYRPSADFEDRRALIRSVADAGGARRTRLLGLRVLRQEEDVRLIEEALVVLGNSRSDEAVAEALALAAKCRGPERWRWLDALGRMPHPEARRYLLQTVSSSAASTDRTAALRALARPDATDLLPVLSAAGDGCWQLQAARVEVLAQLEHPETFPLLVKHLEAPSARARADAHALLVERSGRDLGAEPEPWMTWWRARSDPSERIAASGSSHAYGRYYGIPLHPGRICFILDVSGSMNEPLTEAERAYAAKAPHLKERTLLSRLDLCRAELLHAIEQLTPTTQFQIVHYATDVRVWARQGPRRADAEARADARRLLRRLEAGGHTNIHGALLEGFVPREDATFRECYQDSFDTLFFLSDGEPTAGAILDRSHILAEVREWNRVRMIRIHTIGIGPKADTLLADLARMTGGIHVDLTR